MIARDGSTTPEAFPGTFPPLLARGIKSPDVGHVCTRGETSAARSSIMGHTTDKINEGITDAMGAVQHAAEKVKDHAVRGVDTGKDTAARAAEKVKENTDRAAEKGKDA
jgi:hypothetical protein